MTIPYEDFPIYKRSPRIIREVTTRNWGRIYGELQIMYEGRLHNNKNLSCSIHMDRARED